MPTMNETNSNALPVYCPHCGAFAFWSGHSTVYSETPEGGQLATQSGKAFFLCACGGESETAISQRTGRLYLIEPEQWRPHWSKSNGKPRGNCRNEYYSRRRNRDA